MKIYAVTLVGGVGSRLFPLSIRNKPKQFHDLMGFGQSMFQATVRRIRGVLGQETEVLVVTNEDQAKMVKDHVPHATVLVEPSAKNTAPAIGLAASWIASRDPDALMVVLPCDHHIANLAELDRVMHLAIDAALRNHMVLIGIKPSFGHPKLGYIRAGQPLPGFESVSTVEQFHEKPGTETAEAYWKSGEWCWNSGMFVWKASVILDAIRETLPKLSQNLTAIQQQPDFLAPAAIKHCYQDSPEISIDHGVLQKSAQRLAMVAAEDLAWLDIGSWDVLADFWPKDDRANRVSGEVYLLQLSGKDPANCLAFSDDGGPVIIAGLEDICVFRANNRVVVCPRDKLHLVGDVAKLLPLELQ